MFETHVPQFEEKKRQDGECFARPAAFSLQEIWASLVYMVRRSITTTS